MASKLDENQNLQSADVLDLMYVDVMSCQGSRRDGRCCGGEDPQSCLLEEF